VKIDFFKKNGMFNGMRWIVFGLILSAFSLQAQPCPLNAPGIVTDPMERLREGPSSPCEKQPAGCIPFDADLYKRCTEIYSASAEFLYWQAIGGGLDYALKMKQPAGLSQTAALGKFQSARFNLDPGFRIGLLYFRALHNWEMRWVYTRMTSRGSNSSIKPQAGNEYLTPTWTLLPSNPIEKANSHIHMNYNVFDMSVDRHFTPNWHLRFRYVAGLLMAWMDQDWKVRYTDTSGFATVVRNRWNFIGAGLKTGIMGDWFLTNDFYLTGQALFGALIGQYENRSREMQTLPIAPGDNPALPFRNAVFSDVRPAFTAQLAIGPSWQKNYEKSRVEIFAGYEMNLWMNLQNTYHSTYGSPSAFKETWINSSLFGLYGLTTRATVDF
jgi:hypothetical protein